MNEDSRYYEVLKTTYEHYLPYLQKDGEDAVILIDPVDKKVIGFHYGETHMGAAFILGGIHFKEDAVRDMGFCIINGFIKHAKEYQREVAYHWDFNNFALCVLYEYLEKDGHYSDFCDKLKDFILIQQDSNNATINWHPMRLYVNRWKYQWTKDEKYKANIESFKKKIASAQYADGFIEDLLPKGTSFNFQYHMFTTSVLAFLKVRGIDVADLNAAVSRAIDMMDYQGDINYLGRGNNQIFAWGPASYLYSVLENREVYNKAFDYVQNRAIKAIKKDNLILNDFDGAEKNWWWDYHFCSVYIAHYAFWLMLAAIENKEMLYEYKAASASDSGVHIHKREYCVVTFDGRKHYLAESGKVIADITDKEGTCYFKGAFGPYYKEYGFKYSSPADSLHNFIGIMQQGTKFGYFVEKPIYPNDIEVKEKGSSVEIALKYKKKVKGIVNLPLFTDTSCVCVMDDAGKDIDVRLNKKFKGPYGMVNLYQSGEITTSILQIKIESKQTHME